MRFTINPAFAGSWVNLAMTVLAVGVLTLPTVVFGQRSVSTEQECHVDKPETTPVSRFRIDEQASTVFDTQTGLTWKRCAEGQTYAAGRCEGVVPRWTWNDAVTKFGVEGDAWRLPNVDELSSIIENRCNRPTANLVVFPDFPSSAFWSASSFASNPESAWWVGFVYSGTYSAADAIKKSETALVRLTHGKEWIDPSGIFILGKAQKAEQERTELANKKREDLILKIATLTEAERKAVISCRDKAACDKAFSLTQIYINQTSDQKIQTANDTIIETYNPTEEGKIGLSAMRIPGKGTSASIRLTAICSEGKFSSDSCVSKKRIVYDGFRPFIARMLKQ